MYRKVLIANRADCAYRLMRTCRYLNIETVLVAARDEPASLALMQSDSVFYTGMSRDAYLNEDNIIDVARETGCEAILPGWGFLSESYRFARRVRLSGMDFIGPRESHMQIFGDKLTTLDVLVPKLHTENCYASNRNDIEGMVADACPSPWMLKGRYGGGGKAIELCHDSEELRRRMESLSARGEMQDYYVEKAISGARHIEIQLFGRGVLGTEIVGIRDCTNQQNHQKWLEYHLEATAIEGLGELSRRVAEAFSEMEYEGWATVEFLYETNGSFHLLEVNPRLQVEHGVTEMTRDLDLVDVALRWQCERRRCAPVSDAKAEGNVVALEFRLYAQSAGKLEVFGFDSMDWPDHPYRGSADYRVETGYVAGDSITGVYDGCLARFMTRARDCAQAFSKMRDWLKAFRCDGVKTNLAAIWNLDSVKFFDPYLG